MNRDEILKTNKCYWDTYADLWFGTTALPTYGVHFVMEDELQLFGDVSGKKMLELCCGSGHSLKYHADRNASELWGVDLSHKQIENARRYLSENGYTANFICSPMEADMDIPKNYFDYIYSIYGIGWTTDLDGTFQKISSYIEQPFTLNPFFLEALRIASAKCFCCSLSNFIIFSLQNRILYFYTQFV